MAGPPPTEYVLGSTPQSAATKITQSGLPVVELKRIRLPAYIDATAILERKGNQLIPSKTGRWGERLSAGMTRALAESLSSRLPGLVVTTAPPVEPPAQQVLLEVMSFEPRADQEVVLVARWTIVGGKARQELVTEQATIVEAVSAPGDSSVVEAMSRAVEGLADHLAADITNSIGATSAALTTLQKR
jgi:uncharacterized lipoprotein YmbA